MNKLLLLLAAMFCLLHPTQSEAQADTAEHRKLYADVNKALGKMKLKEAVPALWAALKKNEAAKDRYLRIAIVNALAARSNAATTRQETAAVYALMQGFIQHLLPQLGADLERSNPERPWRLLNLNFAITAIRTGDATMMRYAFNELNLHLPDECAGFYQEALALASRPGFPNETRQLIEVEYLRWAS